MQDEIAAAVENFVARIKETARQRRTAESAGSAPAGKRMEAAVGNLRDRINRAIQGKDAAREIQEAAKNGHFDIHSDIDLLITGWNEDQNYWKMLAQASELARPYQVSIIVARIRPVPKRLAEPLQHPEGRGRVGMDPASPIWHRSE